MNPDPYNTMCLLLTEKFKVDPTIIHPHTSMQELGLDSLSVFEFIVAIEELFHLRIPEGCLGPRPDVSISLQDIMAILKMLAQNLSADKFLPDF